MDEEIKENGEMATIEDEEEITIEEDYTALEAETIIIDDDSNIQTEAEYEQAVGQKELADGAREALSAVLLSVLEKGEINDDDIAEIAAQQEIYTENVTALKILGLETEDEKSTAGKSTTNVITSNIDYNELMKVLSEKADWLYTDEDGQVMLNGEVVPKLKVVELEAEKIKADVGEFKNLTTENFTATNATIENLKANKADIEYLNANYATIQNLNATNANVTNLQATKADIEDLNATNAEIENLKANKADITFLDANYATIHQLDATNANVTNLQADTANINNALINKANIVDLNATNANVANLQAVKANITDLDAAKADINVLNSNVADITTLVNGNLTSDNIQSMVITGDKFTVANGFIKNAMIDSVAANKINTGTINTNNVSIQSADGSMMISGTTQQFKDKDNKIRIQIGKDATGNFTFALFSQDGVGVLIDENGIKSGAVPNGLIVNDMVADGANISGSKLDINSVINSINNGTTTTIKGTRIQLDEQGQSLQVAFSQLKSKVETIENISIEGDLSSVIEQVTTNTTSINTMQGQISSLISNTTITKENGEVVQLKDEYNSTKDTVNSHTTKIGSLETNLNKVSTGQNKWLLEMFEKGEGIDGTSPITIEHIIGKPLIKAVLIDDSVTNNQSHFGDNYLGRATTHVYLDMDYNWETTATSDDGSTMYVNGAFVATLTSCNPTAITVPFKQGWNKITWVYNEGIGGDGWDFNPRLTSIPQIKYMNAYPMTNVDEVGNILDGNIKTVSSRQTSLEQNLDGFKQTVSNTYSTKTELNNVDGKFANYSTTSDMNSAINQKANEINQSVSETYATKSTVNDLSNNLTNNYSTTSQMNSAINQKANEITSTVSETYATKAALNTVDGKFANYSTTSDMNSAINQKSDAILSTVSSTYATKTSLNEVDGKFADYSTTSAMNTAINQKADSILSTVNNTYATKESLNSVDGKFANYSTTSDMHSAINQKGDSILSSVSNTYATKAEFNNLEIGGTNLVLNSSFANGDNNWNVNGNPWPPTTAIDESTSPTGKALKVTINTTAGGHGIWQRITPRKTGNYTLSFYAKADTDNYNIVIGQEGSATKDFVLTTNWTKYTYTYNKDNLNSNAIIFYTKNNASNSAFYIHSVKLEYGNKATDWTPAPEDIDASITAVDNKFINYSTTSEMNSAINQKANEITSSVSQTYSTKAETNDKINNIKVGGTNFIRNGRFKGIQPNAVDNVPSWTTSGGLKVWTALGQPGYDRYGCIYYHKEACDGGGCYLYQDLDIDTIGRNIPLTLSFDAWREGTIAEVGCRIEYLNANKDAILATENLNYNDFNGHRSYTFTTSNDGNVKYLRVVFYYISVSGAGGGYLATIGNVKLEKGNKETDWSPAPQDIDASIEAVGGKFVNYSTIQQMNSAINQKANEINSSVSSTYSTKQETNNSINNLQGQINDTNNNIFNNYTSKSELNQTTNSITAKFSESGGYNLLRNTGFKNSLNYWGIQQYNSPQNGVCEVLRSDWEWGFPDKDVNCCCIRISNQDSIEYGIAQNFTTTIGKTYTVSFYYASHRMSQANMIIRYPDGNWLTNKSFNPSEKSGGNSDVNNWGIFTHTFTATHDNHTINIVVNSAQDNGHMWIAKPMICEGELLCPYSPHPSEVYDGITQIDKDGIKVYHNNIDGENYTHMSPTGFYIKNRGEDIFKVDNAGLYLKGRMEVTGGSVPSSLLNGQVSDNLIGEWIRNGATNGSNANTWLNNSAPGWNNATSLVEAGHVNWDNAKATLDNNAGKWNDTSTRVSNSSTAWDNAYNRVVDWAYGAVGGRTTINGGLLQTNTVTAQHLAIGDFNNYSQLVPGQSLSNRYGYASWSGSGDHFYWSNGESDFLPFTINETVNPFKQGDKVGFKFEAYVQAEMDVTIGIWFYSGDDSNGYMTERVAGVHLYQGWNSYSTQVTIDCNEAKWARSVAIMISKGAGNYLEVRNVLVARMINNVMIEDGAITANKISVQDLSAFNATIGGFNMYNGKLVGNGGNGVGMSGNGDDWAFWAGSNTGGNAPFHVGHEGHLYATNADISGTITGSTISGSIFKSGTDYNPHKQNITGLQMQDDTIYSYGTKNNGMYAVTKISGGTINIGNGEDGAGLNWSAHISPSDISLFKHGSTGYFYVGTTEAPGSGYSTTTTTIDTTTINIGSRDETTVFKVDYNRQCEFGNNHFTRGTLTMNQLSQGSAGGTQTHLSGTTISATTIYQNGSKVTGSDIILKDNIKKYEGNALDIVNKTNIYSFNRISDPNRTEIGFIAQQVPDELIYQRGKFTAEELEGLTPKEKTALLEQAQIEANKERDITVYDKIAEEVVSFYDLDDKQTQNQIDKIQEEANNIEYTSPVSMLHENNIIGIMWKAIQELSKKVDELSK